MEKFLQQFGSKIKGVLTGFDRICFKGCLRHLAYTQGAANFLARRGVLNKDYEETRPAEAQCYKERSAVERVNSHLHEEHSGRHVRVRGPAKVGAMRQGGGSRPFEGFEGFCKSLNKIFSSVCAAIASSVPTDFSRHQTSTKSTAFLIFPPDYSKKLFMRPDHQGARSSK